MFVATNEYNGIRVKYDHTDIEAPDTYDDIHFAYLQNFSGTEPVYEDVTINLTLSEMDNVLGASAGMYKDVWLSSKKEFKEGDGLLAITHNESKDLGVFNLWKSFNYVKNRGASENIQIDGTFDNVPVYQSDNGLTQLCDENWRMQIENNAFDVTNNPQESKDLLDRHASSLGGYNNFMTMSSVINGKRTEVGYHGFEENEAGAQFTQQEGTKGNLSFYNYTLQSIEQASYDEQFIQLAKGNVVLVNTDIKDLVNVDRIKIECSNIKLNGGYSTANQIGEFDIVTKIAGNSPGTSIIKFDVGDGLIADGEYWTGKVHFKRPFIIDHSDSYDVEISDVKAHTGKNSLKITDNSDVSYYQNNLVLEKGKDYYFSCWISKDGIIKDTYKDEFNVGVRITNHTNLGEHISYPITLIPSGEVINGWQKVEGVFNFHPSAYAINLELLGGAGFYFDDFRFQPKDASMKSYVYDNQDLKLVAELDENNYATFYYYDEGGALRLIKKETEKGIQTIQTTQFNQAQ